MKADSPKIAVPKVMLDTNGEGSLLESKYFIVAPTVGPKNSKGTIMAIKNKRRFRKINHFIFVLIFFSTILISFFDRIYSNEAQVQQ
jgi:hypothetical protein